MASKPSIFRQHRTTNHLLSHLLVRAPQPHHHWNADPQVLVRQHDTLGDHIAEGEPAEDVDEDGLHAGVLQDGVEGLLDGLTGRFAACVEEVGAVAAQGANCVDRVHGQAGAVDCGCWGKFVGRKEGEGRCT